MTNQDSTMSHSTAELVEVLKDLRWFKSVTEDDVTDVYGRSIALIEQQSTRLEHLERALTEAREMTCGTEHCMTCGPIRRAIDRALTQSGNE